MLRRPWSRLGGLLLRMGWSWLLVRFMWSQRRCERSAFTSKQITLNKIATTAEPEKKMADLPPAETPGSVVAGWNGKSGKTGISLPARQYGWLSRLRSYFIFDPLIWAYTLILGTASLVCSLFDRNGRIQHKFARFWSWLVMKTILSPVKVIGMDRVSTGDSKPRVYAVTHAS